ncbi:hypothetical protein [Nonomuraea sp. NPDC001831]|uniref:hypothetical protein n=1 Tax=Nonomuraea sp. NPDC001831 TaxID=3364340 RepID=UPI0036BD9C3A
MQDPLESPWPPTSGSVAHRARHWYQLGHEPGLPGGHVLYPHGLAHLVIVLDGGRAGGSYEPAVFGLRTRPVEVGVPVGARSLDVCMTPRVAHAVFGLPMNRLVDAPVELREATGRAGERLVGALRAASCWPTVSCATGSAGTSRRPTWSPGRGGCSPAAGAGCRWPSCAGGPA